MRFLFLTALMLYKKVWSCGYDSCTQAKQGVLNVHIVPHTHNDAGWVKTVDQYYEDDVRQILDSVVKELLEDREKRFMYVETVYFWRWWGEQGEEDKKKVRTLVNEGRLKFVGGAWTMNDEATTHYQSIIDQFTWGLRKLNETFGPCATPKVAWQIDTFGHSREFASLLAAMGYDGVFLCRIDSEELYTRRMTQTMEFIWRGDDNLGCSSDIFTGVLYNHYTPPNGLDFEWRSSETGFGTVTENAKKFYDYILLLSETYTSNNILIAMGDDFAYTNAHDWFRNLDELISIANKKAASERLNLQLFYSTPDCYLKAVKNSDQTLSIKQDDFFPYDSEKGFWTGYYTSRPSLKYFEREANKYFQMVKQLYVVAGLNQDTAIIDEFRSAMGIMQHHDAITGTEKHFVAEDYKKLLSQAVDNSLLVVDKAFTKFAGSQTNNIIVQFEKCKLNQSECATSETSRNFIVSVYNPLAWAVFNVDVAVPVRRAKYDIYDSNGYKVKAKLVPILKWYQKNIPTRRSLAKYELIFKVKRVGPLGFENFYFQQLLGKTNNIELDIALADSKAIEKKILREAFSTISVIESGYYLSSMKSGAYVFSPQATEPVLTYNFTLSDHNEINVSNKTIVNAILKSCKKRGNIIVLQVAWLCSPINVKDHLGKEVIVRYNTDVKNRGVFFTDSNGRQMMKRYFERMAFFDVAKNYYPVPTKISIKDSKNRFTVITDRAEGGYSPKDGTVELMIDRRLLYDDGLGVEEALFYDESVNIVNHFLIISNESDKQNFIDEKRLTFEINMSPIILFSDVNTLTFNRWLEMKQLNAGLKTNFPEGLHLLTLEPWGEWQLLLRLENYLELSDRDETTIEMDLCDIFTTIRILFISETTLAANQWLDENKKWIWKKKRRRFFENSNRSCGLQPTKRSEVCSAIRLNSKEIRTFIIDYEVKPSCSKVFCA